METLPQPTEPNSLVIFDAKARHWLLFQHPVRIYSAYSVAEVLPVLSSVQSQVGKAGVFAAGFLSYEAAPAFDPALTVKPPGTFPLAWFGLYTPPTHYILPNPAIPSAVEIPNWTPSISRELYHERLAQIKDYIRIGHTYQVNFTFRLRASFTGDPWLLFLQMIHAQPEGYGAYLNTSAWTIACASPELFFLQFEDRLLCRPMKGTAPRGLTHAHDLQNQNALRHSEKNRAENLMIVDMARNDLGRIARAGSVQVQSLFDLEKYPTVWQMTSSISCQTDACLADIFKALFPAASITGAPKPRTMEIIAELEETPRNIYTGTIGFIAPEHRAQFNVAIRTVLIDPSNHTAEYGVGGGIVWDSSATDEYEECMTKAKILDPPRPPFQLLESLLWTPKEGCLLQDLHLKRLEASAAYFDFQISLPQIQAALLDHIRHLPPHPHKIRLLVSAEGLPTIQSESIDCDRPAQPLRVRLASSPVHTSHVFLYHKTTHREVYEKAAKVCRHCDEVLLWNQKGELTEACASNIVLELDGKCYTPPVACGLLAGTYRAWLLAQGEIEEKVLYPTDLHRCSHLYLINSVRKQRQAHVVQDP
jgi:para-aminobenzoate synthetase/4-amino-4-deoxychorismate lyase